MPTLGEDDLCSSTRSASFPGAALASMPGGPIRLNRGTEPDSLQKLDSPAVFLDSGKGHAAHSPLADIDDRFSELVEGVARAFGAGS
jgi:hypothetical protein